MRVKGIYDGEKVVPLEPLALAPNTSVEIIIPDDAGPEEAHYWERLAELGLVTVAPTAQTQPGDVFEPVAIEGEPLSQTIIESRR